VAATVASAAFSQFVLYRRVFRVPRAGPFDIGPEPWPALIVSAALVVVVAALACRSFRSRAAAAAGGVLAALTADVYLVVVERIMAGPHGLVGHDIEFGGVYYWFIFAMRLAAFVPVFACVAAVSWPERPAARP
jgi:hypothetical protein